MNATKEALMSMAPFEPGEMAELSLLVPAWQANALVEIAEQQGMTVAQLLRRMLSQALVALPVACS